MRSGSFYMAVAGLIVLALPVVGWGDPVVVSPMGGTPEQKFAAREALVQAVTEARAAKQRTTECISKLDEVKREIENDQPTDSPVVKAREEFGKAERAYRDYLKSIRKGLETVDPTAKSLAKARMTVAKEKYQKLRDELLKSDSRWLGATAPLRQALYHEKEAQATLQDRRMDCLVLVGRIAGIYQPPHDPSTAQRKMKQFNALTMARLEAFKRGNMQPWLIGVTPRMDGLDEVPWRGFGNLGPTGNYGAYGNYEGYGNYGVSRGYGASGGYGKYGRPARKPNKGKKGHKPRAHKPK